MKPSELIRQASKEMNVSLAEIARRTNQSSPNLSKKMRNETIGYDEFIRCIEATGARYSHKLIFPGSEESKEYEYGIKEHEKIKLLEAQIAFQEQKNDYLTGLIRHIRTSLNDIEGCADIILKHSEDENKVVQCIGRIKTANHLINDILNETQKVETKGRSAFRIDIESMHKKIVGKRILLVEDNDINREVTKDVLSDSGMIVDTARDGLSAINAVKENGTDYYNYILMDIYMPIMDGNEATQIIRKLPGGDRIPIIAVSADAFEADREFSIQAGANAYVNKPIIFQDLFEVMISI